MIVNIRGTSGSGKTFAVRKVMERAKSSTKMYACIEGVTQNGSRPDGHMLIIPGLKRPVAVIGDYSSAECGGCDKIKTQMEAETLVRHANRLNYHVLFEGLLITHIYRRWADLCEEDIDNFMFLGLSTPVNTCIERVTERRTRKGNNNPLNPANTIKMYDDLVRVASKCEHDGLPFMWVAGDDAPTVIYNLFKNQENKTNAKV